MESLSTIVPIEVDHDQADDGTILRTLAGTHRRIVADDLVALAEHAADLIEATGCAVGDPAWSVLRNAHHAALALAEVLNASRTESRDMAALGEHALLVLGAATATAKAPEPARSLDDRIVAAIFELPQTTAQIGEVLDVDGEHLEAALHRMHANGRIGIAHSISDAFGTRWVASA